MAGIGHNGGPPLGDDADASAVSDEDVAVAQMRNLPEVDIAKRARRALLARLTAKAEAGTLSHQEAGVLRNLLRDAGLMLELAPTPNETRPLPVDDTDLPEFED